MSASAPAVNSVTLVGNLTADPVYDGSIEPSDWEIEARARVAEAYPPRPVVVPAVDTSDDRPS